MDAGDIEDIATLLGDPSVMAFYRRPKTRAEARAWIDWTCDSYATHGFGLWVLDLCATGEFVGQCGLTMQDFDGVPELEVGYHVSPPFQRRGFATEAARATRDWAQSQLAASRLAAIVHPDNIASRRVAERIGLAPESQSLMTGNVLYSMSLIKPQLTMA